MLIINDTKTYRQYDCLYVLFYYIIEFLSRENKKKTCKKALDV